MIEARRLHILRAVADHRTVTAAAAALYLTPSAVSQQLTALEQETGHRLVERGAKGVRLTPAGEILPGDHAIAPVMIGDAAKAARLAELLLERGVYVIGFSYPVVPQGAARIRVQLSAAHSTDDVNRAVDAFVDARTALEAETA